MLVAQPIPMLASLNELDQQRQQQPLAGRTNRLRANDDFLRGRRRLSSSAIGATSDQPGMGWPTDNERGSLGAPQLQL